MRTRTKGATKTSEAEDLEKSAAAPKVQLGAESLNPPFLFVLPDEATPEARIISIKNPRYFSEDRYYVCPSNGIYEFTKIAAPKTTPRSWLLTPTTEEGNNLDNGSKTSRKGQLTGYVTRNADLFIATPIDPVFLLLPILNPLSKSTESPKKLFLSGDDYLEKIGEESPQLASLLRLESLRSKFEERMKVVCETVEAGDETMYRWSEEKILHELLRKAKEMVRHGLPASLEEKLIRKALEVPMLSIKREDSSLQGLSKEDAAETNSAYTSDSQTTNSAVDSASVSFSEVSTAATSFSEANSNDLAASTKTEIEQVLSSTPEGVTELLRLRTAFLFICSNYIAPYIGAALKKALSSPTSPVNFELLDTHLAHLAKLRQEALASRSLGDYSRKRGLDDDDETIEMREEKKRKREEEDKRKKAGVSVGLRKLQKVNTSGMKKMSDFFKKK